MTRLTHKHSPSEVKDALLRIWEDPIALAEALGYAGTLSSADDGTLVKRKAFGDFHREMLRHAHSGPRTSTVVPRGHAKSTILTVVDTIHHLLHDPASRNLIACATLDLARKLVGEIRDRLNGDLEILPGLTIPVREAFPWIAPTSDPRKQGPCDQFNVSGRSGKGREPSVFAASVESNLAGNHPTRAVVDDPSNEQNSRTYSRRRKVIEFIETLEPLMYAPDSPIMHIGTPWAFQDVTAYLARRDDWTQFRFGVWDGYNPDTLRQDGNGPGPDGAYPLCPSFLNASEIADKEAGLSRTFFAAQYLCEPVPSEDALFDLDLVAAATDPELSLEKLPDGPRLILYDPVARMDNTQGDLNGIVIVKVLPAHALGLRGFPPDRNVFVPIEAIELSGGADAAVHYLEEVAVPKHQPEARALWVEQVAAQSLFKPWLEERGRIQGVRIRGQKVGNSSLDFRLMGLQTAMRKGYLRLPPEFPGRSLLVQRLTEYPLSDSDDLISALALLSTEAERRGPLPGLEPPPERGTPLTLHPEQLGTTNDGNYWSN